MKNRQTKLIVNISAMEENYKEIQRLQPNKKILPVLKAGGYGIGLEGIEAFVKRLNIDVIGTAIVDEGIVLRDELGFKGEVIVLNQPSMEEIQNIVEYDLTVGCCYIEFIQALNSQAKLLNKKAKIHIEIETGMGRTGVQKQNLDSFLEKLKDLQNIEVEGIYTHFATSDIDLKFTKHQIDEFEEVVKKITSQINTIKYIHCGNSSAVIQIRDLPGNMVRPGIMLYGYFPDESLKEKAKLHPSCILKSKISFIKEVEKDTSISYGRTFITKRKSIIANVPIGYADGIRRSLSNNGFALVDGQKAPIVGKVCMDSFMIDVTDIPDVKIGDEIFIWDNDKITLEEIAKQCGTINYEILSTISNRVVREILSINNMWEK